MEKDNIPKRKRWIDFLPDEIYDELDQKDKDNYLHFQSLSKSRVQQETKLKKLKKEISELRVSISDTNMKEEKYYLSIQHLHNVFGCRVDVVRGLRKPNSLKEDVPSGKISYKRKTHNGIPLKPYYVWNGKVVSSSLERSKSVYFQTEEKLLLTVSELKGININEVNENVIRNFLKTDYTEYVRILMRKSGVEKFNKMTILFDNFIKWYKNGKK